ncbi:MAG: ketopantoate reductase family protein [Hyphomicrobiaceae bacterium]
MRDGILIWGAGAIGGTLGAYLIRAGQDVTFVDVVPEHVAAINSSGLSIEGPIDTFTVKAKALLPAEVKGTWKRIFLAVKAQHTADAARALKPFLAEDGYVLSLQNGLCELMVQEHVGRDRTMGAFINYGSDWLEPGRILYSNPGAFVVGELDGAMTPRVRELYDVVRLFEPNAILTGDIWSYLWGKLAYVSFLFAQGLGKASIADCLARPELLPVWRSLGGEILRVAQAEGVEARGFNGFDPEAFRPGASEAAAPASVEAMVVFNRPNPKSHSGIWRDLWVRKRRSEVDAQIAPIADIGEKHGLKSPTVRRLVALIHEVEDGKRPMRDENLLELLDAR